MEIGDDLGRRGEESGQPKPARLLPPRPPLPLPVLTITPLFLPSRYPSPAYCASFRPCASNVSICFLMLSSACVRFSACVFSVASSGSRLMGAPKDAPASTQPVPPRCRPARPVAQYRLRQPRPPPQAQPGPKLRTPKQHNLCRVPPHVRSWVQVLLVRFHLQMAWFSPPSKLTDPGVVWP